VVLLSAAPPSVVVPPQRTIPAEAAAERLGAARPPEMAARLAVPLPEPELAGPPSELIAAADTNAGQASAAGRQPPGNVRPTPEPTTKTGTARERSPLPSGPEGTGHKWDLSPFSALPGREPPPVAVQPKAKPALGAITLEEGGRGPAPPEHDMTAMLPRAALELPHASLPPQALPERPARSAPADGTRRVPATFNSAAGPSTEPGPTRPGATPEEHAQINVEELAARIAGVNLSLRALEGELDESHEWNADRLEAVVQRLDILVLRQKDLGLFRDLIPAADQARVGRIEPGKKVIAALAARIAALRSRLQTEPAPGDEPRRQATLKHLDELSDRLAGLAGEP
jgi:hypothetical protein